MPMRTIDDNEFISVILYTGLAFVLMTSLLVAFFYFSRKKIMRQELEKRDMEIRHQKELLKSVIQTQEEERKRIAQDLHDDISSKLNIVSLNTHLLTTPGVDSNELRHITENIINLTGKALENSRRIAHDLLPPVLEKFGLAPAIEELCQEFKSVRKLKVSFENKVAIRMEDELPNLHVFRILQELMNNSLRHGKAKHISIKFVDIEGVRTCLYQDDGLGMDVPSAMAAPGLGLKNILSRIEIINGTITFKSSPGKGLQATFTF